VSRPDPFPPLRVAPDDARALIEKRRREGADLFQRDTRYTWEMGDRFETWYQETASDLERSFWSADVAKWFRQGTCWLVGSGNYDGIIKTRDDRLKLLDELLEIVQPPPIFPPVSSSLEEFDVCLSFAGEQRYFVEEVAKELRQANVRVFYDRYEEVDLWGKDLYAHLNAIYRDRAKYCVIFISKEYAQKQWTSHERKSAQSRAFRESREYILPARFDDTELPGLNETVGYVDLRQTSPAKLAQMVIRKIGGDLSVAHMPTISLPSREASGANPDPTLALVAEWQRRDMRIESDRHDYRLLIDLHNVGRKRVNEWRIQVWFPNAFLPDATSRAGHKLIEDHDGIIRSTPGACTRAIACTSSTWTTSWITTTGLGIPCYHRNVDESGTCAYAFRSMKSSRGKHRYQWPICKISESLPNFTMKLVRPGFDPPAEPAAATQARRRHGGCRSHIASSGVLRGNRRAARLRRAATGRTAYREIR